jgi:AraC-like DNA-binding protein
MDLLADTSQRDPLSVTLRAVRVRSTILCRSILTAPWGWTVAGQGVPIFHVVLQGECWLEADGLRRPLHLRCGDVLILPSGQQHTVRDQPQTTPLPLDEALARAPIDDGGRTTWGGGGAVTSLLCGTFHLDAGAPPLLRLLPPALHVPGTAGEPARELAGTLELLMTEAGSGAPGSAEVTARLADAALAQVLRASLIDANPALLARDRQVAQALALIESRPGHPWSVEEVAKAVGLSRSAFTSRFRQQVGESPKRYVTRSRLAHAARLLDTTDATLAEIARLAGYESEFSFGKAFKQTLGVAPGAYRRQR